MKTNSPPAPIPGTGGAGGAGGSASVGDIINNIITGNSNAEDYPDLLENPMDIDGNSLINQSSCPNYSALSKAINDPKGYAPGLFKN